MQSMLCAISEVNWQNRMSLGSCETFNCNAANGTLISDYWRNVHDKYVRDKKGKKIGSLKHYFYWEGYFKFTFNEFLKV